MNSGAGWYKDPKTPSRLRYWDGSQWTSHYADMRGVSPPTGRRSKFRRWAWVLGGVALGLVIIATLATTLLLGGGSNAGLANDHALKACQALDQWRGYDPSTWPKGAEAREEMGRAADLDSSWVDAETAVQRLTTTRDQAAADSVFPGVLEACNRARAESN
jgi:hypothetical protein